MDHMAAASDSVAESSSQPTGSSVVPLATVMSQLQGLSVDGLPLDSTPLEFAAAPQLSSSPNGSLASGSSISRVSAHSDLGGFPSLSSISALQSSLHSRLNDSAPGHGGGLVCARIPATTLTSAAYGVLAPDAHASIPGSFHGSVSNSGSASPQRFVGSLGTASEPPTLPPAGESAFACFSGGASSAPPPRFDSRLNGPMQRFGVKSLSNRSPGTGSSAFLGYGNMASSLPQQPRPPLSVPIPPQLQQQFQQSGQHNPFPLYNMQQPSTGFYASSHSSLTGLSSAPSSNRNGSSGTVSPAWPPPAASLNLNKAITKRLTSATHFQQLLDIIAESSIYFDEVNVATALHRLARLHCTASNSNAAAVIVNTDQFKVLLSAIAKLLPRFEAQAVSNTAWALATLGFVPEGDLMQDLALRAATIIRSFRPQATSNTLWAYAKLGVMPPEAFMAAAAQQLHADLFRSVPQDLSNSLWAFATLRWSPGKVFLNGVATQALNCMARFKPQEVANTLWAYATLGHDPRPPLLDAMAAHVSERIHICRPQAVSNSLWAYARLKYNPGQEFLDAATRRAMAVFHQYTPQELGNTLWAVAALEHHPGQPFLEAAAAHVVRRVEQLSATDCSNVLWSFSRLFTPLPPDLLDVAGGLVLKLWPRFRATEAANAVWALSILRAAHPHVWSSILAKLAQLQPSSFDDADLHQIFQAYHLLEPSLKGTGSITPSSSFPHALLQLAEARWKEAVHPLSNSSPLLSAVSQSLWRLGVKHTTQHVTSDGLFCVDIALEGEQVIIELDGPDSFSTNSYRPLGRMVGRRCMLEACGYIVRSIAYYEWNANKSVESQQLYLTKLLSTVYC